VKTQFSVGTGSSVTYFPAGDVDSIVVDVRGGDDEVLVHSRVTAPAFVLGGFGNDSLTAGGGASVLVGGSGDDQLRGGLGRDILIGGLGNDDLQGDPTSDLLVDGAAPQEGNLDALSAALAEWVAGNENGALTALGL
jgi:Ca2+-binding RTX toxin-like protein